MGKLQQPKSRMNPGSGQSHSQGKRAPATVTNIHLLRQQHGTKMCRRFHFVWKTCICFGGLAKGRKSSTASRLTKSTHQDQLPCEWNNTGKIRFSTTPHHFRALESCKVVCQPLDMCRNNNAGLCRTRAGKSEPIHLVLESVRILGGDEVNESVAQVRPEFHIPWQVEEVIPVAKAFLVDVHHHLFLCLAARDIFQHHRCDGNPTGRVSFCRRRAPSKLLHVIRSLGTTTT